MSTLTINVDMTNKALVKAISLALAEYAGASIDDAELPDITENMAPVGKQIVEDLSNAAAATVTNRTPAASIFDPEDDVGPDIETDQHGVPFNAEFCSKAADPFYKGGNKRAGQWKRRQGVAEADYDKWYASAKPAADMNTAGAFSNGTPPDGPAATPDPTAPGELMVWFSEQQSAGCLTHEDLAAAYVDVGFQPDALFGDDEAVTRERVALLLSHLKPRVKS